MRGIDKKNKGLIQAPDNIDSIIMHDRLTKLPLKSPFPQCLRSCIAMIKVPDILPTQNLHHLTNNVLFQWGTP
ncbi:MAG: hypothetical protein ACI9UT_001914 [Flavobacteriales bacterium]|jgi:hypothetical protein